MIKIFVPVKDFFDNGGVLVEGRSLYVPANHKKTEFVEVGSYITDKSQASTFSVNNLDTILV